MSNQADSFWEWLRTSLWPALDGCLGVRFVAPANNLQYVGTIHMLEDEIEAVLRQLGFRRNPVAFLKSRAWSPFDADGISEGSWVWRSPLLAHRQLHVTLFDNEDDGSYDVLAHWELSWIRHPTKHYHSEGFDPVGGREEMYRRLVGVDIHPFDRYGILR